MLVLGIDSAKRSGWAVVRRVAGAREELVEFGVTDADTAEAVDNFAQWLTSKYAGLAIVAIEDNYLDQNVATLKSLARKVGRWQQAFEVRGNVSRLVMPSIWQDQMLRGLIEFGSGRDTRKKAAKTWVRGTFRREAQQDAADAIVMATWMLRQLVMSRLVEGPPAD